MREIEDTHPVEGFAHTCLLTFIRFYIVLLVLPCGRCLVLLRRVVGQLGHDGLFVSHSVAGEAPYGAAMKRVRCDIQYSIHSISQANLCFVGEMLRCNKLEMRAQWQILAFFCCNVWRV